MKKTKLLTGMAWLLFGAGILSAMAGCAPEPEETVPRPVVMPYLSEAMNRNRTVVADADGTYTDWVELCNPGTEPFDLTGYTLSDNEKNPGKWAFPDKTVLQPGEHKVIFCSGSAENRGSELHTSFGISRIGESVVLADASGAIVSRLDIPQLPEDISCGKASPDSETLVYYMVPSPGAPNSSEFLDDLSQIPRQTYSLVINEYTSSNDYQFFDHDGDCPTWAEILNYGDSPITLGGMYLSDDPENCNKWQFPKDLVLNPGEYLLVYLTGKDKVENGELHADFRFSSNDTHLILSDQALQVIDSVETVPLEGGASYGRLPGDADTWQYFANPTPGSENSSVSFETLAASTALPNRKVWINEVLAVSGRDSDFEEDWIELYNGSDESVDLTGWRLSDSGENPAKYVFPETVLEPGAYLVLQADGTQLPFSLSSAGERLYLMRPDGTLCDRFDTGRQINGVSSGRGSGTDDSRLFFYEPTPGAANAEGLTGYTRLPEFSETGIYLKSGSTVSLSADGDIYYTLSGTEPTQDSYLYEGPIEITENTVIRAAAFADGKVCGGIATHTYIVDPPHDISVACISTEPGNLFNEWGGIYTFGAYASDEFPYFGANFWGSSERPIHFEFYESDGRSAVGFDAGVKIFGQFSRGFPQKSLSVHMREGYGESKVRYPFFDDNPVLEYHDLLLRTSGQDWNASKIRDALVAQIVKGQMDLDLMDYRPVALYINGEYWGLYNLRDKINEQYLYTHHGLDPDNVDIIRGDTMALSGDMDAYYDLMNYFYNHDLSDPECFAYAESILDVEEFLDYWIAETFFANTDTGNIKMCRERSEGSRWRMALYDTDYALFPTTYTWNMLSEALDSRGHGVNNGFPTTILRGLLENEDCRQYFIERYAHHLNTTFAPERTSEILHRMADAIASEIPRQYDRWGVPTVTGWEYEIENLEEILAERHALSKQHLQECFYLSDEQMQALFPES